MPRSQPPDFPSVQERIARYREQAKQALARARAASDPEACSDLLIIAASWHAMASGLEKSKG